MKVKKICRGVYEYTYKGLVLQIVSDNGSGSKWGVDFFGDSWDKCMKMDKNFHYGIFQGETKAECVQIVHEIFEQWKEWSAKKD